MSMGHIPSVRKLRARRLRDRRNQVWLPGAYQELETHALETECGLVRLGFLESRQ